MSVRPGPRVLIVIVNYRTPDLTIQCLRSLAPEVAVVSDARVALVDNCSPDDSFERLARAIAENGWSGWVHLVKSERNGGFAYGNNRGIEAGDAAFGPAKSILHLNSDTIVNPGCLRATLEALEGDATVGALSCRLLNADGSLQNAARRFPSPMRLAACALGLPWKVPALFAWADTEDPGWDREHLSRDVDWLGGAFLLVRGDLLRRIGGLDERFFFYGEDIEFCHRVHREGMRCRYEAGPTTVHLGGSSSDATRMGAKMRNTHYWSARYLVQRLCYGALAAWFVRAVDTLTIGLRLAVLRLRGRTRTARYEQLSGAFAVLRRPLGGTA
jgi:GT2 family glycosyltransferase